MVYTLSMTFVGSSGEKTIISIENVRENLTETEAKNLMDLIIAKNIFLTKKGTLVEKASAQLIQREATKFNIA